MSESRQPDARRDPERDRREPRDPVHEGHARSAGCGFSARTVAILQSLGQPFAAVDILPDPRIRQELSALSNWPTIPQLFVDGELVGGCDIVTEMYESGELQHGARPRGRERRCRGRARAGRRRSPAADDREPPLAALDKSGSVAAP